MPITVVNNNSLVSALQQTNPITINLPSAVDMSSVALQAAVEAEGWSQDANDAADRAEVAASALGETACTFHPRDYIPAAQMVHILNGDTDSQDEAVVTAGLRAMHDAAMAWLLGRSDCVAIMRYDGEYAVNDELFSETFADNLWTFPRDLSKWVIDPIGVATFVVKNWVAQSSVRNSGMWAGITTKTPSAIFRWEQKSGNPLGPTIERVRFIGTAKSGSPGLDPIGIKTVRCNGWTDRDIEVRDLTNTGVMHEGLINSRSYNLVNKGCGFQPTDSFGDGIIPSTVLFTVSGADITASEPVFTAAHTGKNFMVHGAGPNGHVHGANITYVDATHATFAVAATTSVSGVNGSFSVLRCSATSGSPVISVPSFPDGIDFVGRYVTATFAGWDDGTPDMDHLTSRVIAQDATAKTITLADNARNTVLSVPLLMSPAMFISRSASDYTLNDGQASTANNDISIYGLAAENPAYNSAGATSAVGLVIGNMVDVTISGGKIHGQSSLYNNFGSNFAIIIGDDCDGLSISGAILKWGKWSASYGSMVFTGANCSTYLRDCFIGNNFASYAARHFYLAPQTASDEWIVGFGGTDQSGNGWPNTNQGLARYGTYGTAANITAIGPLVGQYDEEPVLRHRSGRFKSMGFGADPTNTAMISTSSGTNYSPLEFWRGADKFLWRATDANLSLGVSVGGATETYPIQVAWNASGGSIVVAANYLQLRKPRLTGVPSYANNAAAISGGLSAGDVYQVSGSNPRQLAIVY